MNRRLRFLWLSTAVSAVSLLLATGVARLVWLGVLALCAGGLLLARRAVLKMIAQIDQLPKARRREARALVQGQGRYLLVRLEDL